MKYEKMIFTDKAIDKWLFRQNARNKMEFGVEMPITYGPISARAGISNRRHYCKYNPSVAKQMSKENAKVLKLMQSNEYMQHRAKLREAAIQFYKEQRGFR